MPDNIFNIFAAIGIGLTFIASLAAVFVSVASIRNSKKTAKHSNYLNTITATRYKWSVDLRESASNYFARIARLCDGQEENLIAILNEFTVYHFEIVLLIFKQDRKLHDLMSAIRSKAFEIVDLNNLIIRQHEKAKSNPNYSPLIDEDEKLVIEARSKIYDLRRSIIEEYQSPVFDEIRRGRT
ncbi:MAG: hypothetical protein FWF88_05370 [Peptococcaceae bacterium]|nr:hypothetical protein [Peptococcaceae bacterium]